eukprot:6208933-Pleurochrysis_carterae.AAC.1
MDADNGSGWRRYLEANVCMHIACAGSPQLNTDSPWTKWFSCDESDTSLALNAELRAHEARLPCSSRGASSLSMATVPHESFVKTSANFNAKLVCSGRSTKMLCKPAERHINPSSS